MRVSIADSCGLVRRRVEFETAGETLAGHKHALDHVTLVCRGRVRFHGEDCDRTLEAGEAIDTAAAAEHAVTALDAGSVIVCCFAVPPNFGWALRRELTG